MKQMFAWLVCLLLVGCTSPSLSRKTSANRDVLRVAQGYPNGGKYLWKGSGTPHAIVFKDETILKAGEGGTYCSGFTFTVAMKTAVDRGLLNDKSVDQIRKFQKEWYGVTGDTEKQAGPALENLNIGRSVSHAEAKAGDFIQFWRGKSGHSAIFLKWIQENGISVGFEYRSTQKSTDGIGNKIEYFNDASGKKGEVVRSRTYFARLN